jgi:hypothetical protein
MRTGGDGKKISPLVFAFSHKGKRVHTILEAQKAF